MSHFDSIRRFAGAFALLLGAFTGAHADLHPAISPPSTPVLDRIRAAHSLTCAIVKEEEDYSRAEDHGNRAAFDLDICKAVAVATLGPGAKLIVQAYPDEPAAVKALQQSEVDLIASASPTLVNTARGIRFSRPTFYDGQSMLLLNNPAIHSAADLAGKKVCFLITTASEAGLHTYAARRHISYIWYPFSEAGEMYAAFFTGNCDAITSDVSQLANVRGISREHSGSYSILPEIFRNDPLAPASDGADGRFATIIAWTVDTLIRAEELGVTQAKVDALQASDDPEVKALLGDKFGTGAKLGLDDHWGANVLKATGNYGEIFDRDLGEKSPFRLDRGANRLWKNGGAMIALPPEN